MDEERTPTTADHKVLDAIEHYFGRGQIKFVEGRVERIEIDDFKRNVWFHNQDGTHSYSMCTLDTEVGHRVVYALHDGRPVYFRNATTGGSRFATIRPTMNAFFYIWLVLSPVLAAIALFVSSSFWVHAAMAIAYLSWMAVAAVKSAIPNRSLKTIARSARR